MDKTEILLVEDEADARRAIANELQAQGARVLTAADDEEALKVFFRRVSSISAVVTDMRLRGGGKDDLSGGALAEQMKSLVPNLPIYCNSAIDVRDRFSVFDAYYVKGARARADNIYDSIPDIMERAASYERDRFASVPGRLMMLKDKYQISDGDFFDLVGSRRLREFEQTALLLFHRAAEDAADPSPTLPTTDPTTSRIEIVEPEDGQALGVPIQQSVPVVIERTEDVWLAELFGFPLIYTYAETQGEAVEFLLKFLWEWHAGNDRDSQLADQPSVDILRFGAFLRLIFGD